jgi:putative N-acetylmannosamine-6-phosphate epimerase
MPKLINLLSKNKMTLIAALPKNDPELAEAAIAGGADALQLHINAHGFGDFKKEKENLEKILSVSKVPVGIVPGQKEHASQKEMDEMVEMGFDFFNMNIEHLPGFSKNLKGISKILALGSRFTIEIVLGVKTYGADAVDAAIIPSSEYGKDLLVGDLQNYISIVISAGIPVIIPTQRSIRPSEVAIISDTGAKGMILTSVVTGTTPKHIKERVQEYRVAADDLG